MTKIYRIYVYEIVYNLLLSNYVYLRMNTRTYFENNLYSGLKSFNEYNLRTYVYVYILVVFFPLV